MPQTTLMLPRAVSATGDIAISNVEVLELATAGTSDITRTLPAAALCQGGFLTVKKVDSGAGAVIIVGNGSETIDGDAFYKLVNQYQHVRLASDGTGWNVIGGN